MSLSLYDRFERALDDLSARVCHSASGMAVAYSGGLDSSVLLHLAVRYHQRYGIRLQVFHVHHGLSPHADAWLAHCAEECARLQVPFAAERVTLVERSRHGTEQAARMARYAALGAACRRTNSRLLLTAHHRDDQAETVLLQMLRGSGVAGIGGMEACGTAPGLLGDEQTRIARPLLDVARAELAAYAAQEGIRYVEDESNADHRYTRNALRHTVFPVLGEQFPGFEQRLARLANHARAAQGLLTSLAEIDLARCRIGSHLDLASLGALDTDRIDNLLRHWFALHRLRMPSTAWLQELRAQLFSSSEDARLRVTHPDCEIRRYRGQMRLLRRLAPIPATPQPFVWKGEKAIEFPGWGGSLQFVADAQGGRGVDADWLRERPLELGVRRGSEMLKLEANRPSRSLKHHYQASGIPEWERERLPVVRHAGQLLFAAGLGWNWRQVPIQAGGVQLHWHAAGSDFTVSVEKFVPV